MNPQVASSTELTSASGRPSTTLLLRLQTFYMIKLECDSPTVIWLLRLSIRRLAPPSAESARRRRASKKDPSSQYDSPRGKCNSKVQRTSFFRGNMSDSILTALIGIAGTVLGTVLGWLLSTFSRRGRLEIYTSAWHESFEFNNVGVMSPSATFDEAEAYFYQLSLNIYNSSCDNMIIRNLRIEFLNGSKVVFSDNPKNSDSGHSFSGGVVYHSDFEILNVPPKSVVPLHLHGGFWRSQFEGFERLNFVDCVRIAYKGEKDTDLYVQIGDRIWSPRFDTIREREE